MENLLILSYTLKIFPIFCLVEEQQRSGRNDTSWVGHNNNSSSPRAACCHDNFDFVRSAAPR